MPTAVGRRCAALGGEIPQEGDTWQEKLLCTMGPQHRPPPLDAAEAADLDHDPQLSKAQSSAF